MKEPEETETDKGIKAVLIGLGIAFWVFMAWILFSEL